MKLNDNDEPCRAEAAIAVEALAVALEQLMIQPDARKVLSHLQIMEVLARQALSALQWREEDGT